MGVLVLGIVVLVIFFTRGVFSRDLTQAMRRVTQREEELQEKADILEQRLGQMEREYQAKLKRAETEASQFIQEAKQQAMNIRTAAVEEAKHRARQLLLEAEQGKAQLKTELARELGAHAVHHTCETLRALLTPEQLSALHSQLVRELLEALKRVDVRALHLTADKVEVVTAQPLDSAESLRLTQWAAASVGSDVPIKVSTDSNLVAGCIVRAGATVVDNSLANRLTRNGQG